jgi:replicative DNA helicase
MILKKILAEYIQGEEPTMSRREVQERANKLAKVVEDYLTADNTVSMTIFEYKNKMRMVKEEALDDIKIDLITLVTYARSKALGKDNKTVLLANKLLEKINPKPL